MIPPEEIDFMIAQFQINRSLGKRPSLEDMDALIHTFQAWASLQREAVVHVPPSAKVIPLRPRVVAGGAA